eukprot:Gb_09535 [translate_table: standard]
MKATAKKSGIQGRIVNVSSYGHNFGYEEGIRFDKINEESDFTPFKAYAQSKLAILLHTIELARRLQDEEANVTVNALHPGVVATSISNHNKTLGHLRFSYLHDLLLLNSISYISREASDEEHPTGKLLPLH